MDRDMEEWRKGSCFSFKERQRQKYERATQTEMIIPVISDGYSK
jgi:hypothetical protein